MILDELEELFEDLDIDEPSLEQLNEMYEIYKSEICKIIFNGEQIVVNKNRSRHPICRGMNQSFEHIITRKSHHSGKRNFDNQRANRIHWIKPIIDNYEDSRVHYFEELNSDNQLQYFFYLYERDFIVILRALPQGNMLITSYYVDDYQKNYFKKKYEKYRDRIK